MRNPGNFSNFRCDQRKYINNSQLISNSITLVQYVLKNTSGEQHVCLSVRFRRT